MGDLQDPKMIGGTLDLVPYFSGHIFWGYSLIFRPET
jgi:hypothetical protein